MSIEEMGLRLLLATGMAGVIGFDRAYKHRPAGIRTHMLVCVGSAIIALIQTQTSLETISLVETTPELSAVLKSDSTRLIAQVVSGIGFLGAGSIVVTKNSVLGLTTAASLWATGGLGLAIGMGFYEIAVVGFVTIVMALTIVHRVLKVPTQKKLEIQFYHRIETKEYINQYFNEHKITVQDVDFRADIQKEKRIYQSYYIISFPIGVRYTDIIEDLSSNPNILRIRLINI